jgi:hypothetical protein
VQYKKGAGFEAGAEITGTICGAAYDAACGVKANCVHAKVGGIWTRSFRALAAGKASTDAADETDAVCKLSCGENEHVSNTAADGAKCISDVTGLEIFKTGTTAFTETECHAKVDVPTTWFPVCKACAAGKLRPTAADTLHGGSTTCYDHYCPDNFIVVGNRCQACAAGKTKAWGSGVSGVGSADAGTCDATLCAKDQYVDASHVCQPCAAGTTIAYTGTNGAAEATKAGDASLGVTTCHATVCQENYYVSSKTCVACPANKMRTAGDDARGADTVCAIRSCLVNQYVTAGLTCENCPAGTKKTVLTDRSVTTTCDDIKCATDERVVGKVCVPCPEGQGNVAGDVASGADTTCDHGTNGQHEWEGMAGGADHTAIATACAVNEMVLNHACVACPAGHFAPAGALRVGEDTYCSKTSPTTAAPLTCDTDEHVVDHVCTACPTHYVNAAGDVRNHQNTYCTKKLCAVDQKVVSNACQPCGTLLKAPATWIGGADTTCH